MENLAHSLVGGLIAQTKMGRRLTYAAPVLVIAANLPDIDILTGPFGSGSYIANHRGLSHSVIGLAVGGIAFSLIVYALERRTRGAQSLRFRWVLLPVMLALLSHPMLDWTNTYGIRPWLPWSERWYYGDLVFVVDPWLWLILGGSLILAIDVVRLRPPGWILLILIGLATTGIVTSGWPIARNGTPFLVKAVWLAGIALIIIIRLPNFRLERQTTAIIGLAGMVVYWVAMALLHHQALQQVEAIIPDRKAVQTIAMPDPFNPFAWTCLVEEADAVYRVKINPIKSRPDWSQATRLPKDVNNEIIAKLREEKVGRIFLDFARVYSSTIKPDNDGADVLLVDLRFSLSLRAHVDKTGNVSDVALGIASRN